MASTLDRMSLVEMQAMFRFRWEVASGGGAHPFTDEAIAAIFAASGGMPAEACILADNSLLLAFLQKKWEIDAETSEAAISDRLRNLPTKEAGR